MQLRELMHSLECERAVGGKLETHRILLHVRKVGHIQHCKRETDSSLTQRIVFFLLCHCNFFEYQKVHSPTDCFTQGCFCSLWLHAQMFFGHGVTTDPRWLPQNQITTNCSRSRWKLLAARNFRDFRKKPPPTTKKATHISSSNANTHISLQKGKE